MPTPSAQYAYMTPDGQIIAAPTQAPGAAGGIVPQVGMSYGIVGNTLVQVPQTQYIAVDSATGVVLGQQGAAGAQYAVTAGGEEAAGYVAMGGTTGYFAVGGGGQVLAASDGGNQMAVVQDANGQQRIVALPAPTGVEEVKKPSPSEVTMAVEKPSGSSLDATGPIDIKGPIIVKEEIKEKVSHGASETDVQVENGVELQGPSVQTVVGDELAPTEERPSAADQVLNS